MPYCCERALSTPLTQLCSISESVRVVALAAGLQSLASAIVVSTHGRGACSSGAVRGPDQAAVSGARPWTQSASLHEATITHGRLTCRAARYRSGSVTLRQVQYAAIDLELHARYAPAPGRTVFDGALDAVVARTTVMPPLPEDRCA